MKVIVKLLIILSPICAFGQGLPAGIKIGMEIELTAKWLANLTPFFDFDRFQREANERDLSQLREFPELFDNYLMNPNAMMAIPADLRQRLTSGLTLESLVSAQTTRLLGADGQALAPAAPLAGDRYHQNNGGLIVPRASDWQTLHQRWNALSVEERIRAVRWELLSPQVKAMIAIKISGNKFDPNKQMQLKAEIPDRVSRLLSKMQWHMDLDAIEFKHLTPVESVEEYTNDVMTFARMVGVESKIVDETNSRLEGVSYHVHISSAKTISEREYRLFNEILFLKRVSLGIVSDLKKDSAFSFQDIDYRGLMRKISEGHFETRSHPYPYVEMIQLIVGIVSDPEAQSLSKLEAIRAALLTDEVVDRILRHDPSRILAFDSLLTPAQKAKAETYLTAVLGELEGPAYSVLERMRELEGQPLSDQILSYWPKLAVHPDAEVRARVRVWAETSDTKLPVGVMNRLATELQWKSSQEVGQLLHFLPYCRGSETPEFIRAVVTYYGRERLPAELFKYLGTVKTIPDDILAWLVDRSESVASENLAYSAGIFSMPGVPVAIKKEYLSRATTLWAQMLWLGEMEQISQMRAIMMFGPHWPRSMDDKIIRFLRRGGLGSRQFASILAGYEEWPKEFKAKVASNHFAMPPSVRNRLQNYETKREMAPADEWSSCDERMQSSRPWWRFW